MVDYTQEFPSSEVIHVNHAGVGAWPWRTAEAISRFAFENNKQGSWHYPKWMETELSLRQMLANLIGVESGSDIALLKNTSEGLSVIAYGLQWNPGDEIVIPSQEFPSNRVVWQSLEQYGVIVHLVDLSSGESPEQAIFAACNSNTRLVSVSAVQYASGLRLDTVAIGAYCEKNNILFCVDAIQALGAVPFNATKSKAHFVVADGHKWLLAPEGLALFYCHASVRNKLQLRQYGWHMVENLFDFDAKSWVPAHSARRFECGSPNMTAIHGLHASLSLFEEISYPEIYKALALNIEYLITRLIEVPNIKILSKHNNLQRQSGIILVSHNKIDAPSLYKFLMDNNVFCALRGGGIRLSPHFYSTHKDLSRLLDLFLQLNKN